MLKLPDYKNKTFGVFGLGKAGTAAIKTLLLNGVTVYAWDDSEKSRQVFALDAATAKHGKFGMEPIENWPWREMTGVILSPGVPLTHPAPHPVVNMARDAKVQILGEVDVLYQACPEATYIGITGTNGKSTTTALTGHIFLHAGKHVQVGANFGIPSLSLSAMDEKGYYVLEMSSYQLDLCRHVFFDAAVLLNITPDHIDRHGDMNGYRKAKMKIFERQRENDLALIALDDGCCRDAYIELVRERRSNLRAISVTQKKQGPGIFVDEQGILSDHWDNQVVRYDLKSLPGLKGRHNWQNVAAAYGLARNFGIAPQTIMEAVHSFPGLAHRLEQIVTMNGITFYNDSKATNADATQRALEPFDQIYWILGGRPKEGGIEALAPYFPKIVHAFLIGEAEEEFARTLQGHVPYTRCGTLEIATQRAATLAFTDMRQGAAVVLSPACASFDQWRSFEERGDAFRKYVRQLAGQGRIA